MEGVRRLHDFATGRYVTRHSTVNLVYSGRRAFHPLACEVALSYSEGMEAPY